MATAPSAFVTLVSNDGFEFIVRRESACVAGTIKRMLDPTSKSCRPDRAKHALLTWRAGNFAEAVNGRCVFESIKYGFPNDLATGTD